MDEVSRGQDLLLEWSQVPVSLDDRDLLRFINSEIDDQCQGILTTLRALDESEYPHWRSGLDEDGLDLLTLCLRRWLTRAYRESNAAWLNAVATAVGAVASVSTLPWESWIKGALYCAGELHHDVDEMDEILYAFAAPEVYERWQIARDATSRLFSLEQCHLTLVTTSYGTGLLELDAGPEVPRVGALFTSTIRSTGLVSDKAYSFALDEEDSRFRPVSNVAQLAVAIADAIDESEEFVTSDIRHDQVSATMFDLDFPEPFLPSVGTLSFGVERVGDTEAFTVYVSELFDDEDVTEWGEAVTDDVTVVARDHRLVVLLLSPFANESRAVFESSLDLISQALTETAPEGWEGDAEVFGRNGEDVTDVETRE